VQQPDERPDQHAIDGDKQVGRRYPGGSSSSDPLPFRGVSVEPTSGLPIKLLHDRVLVRSGSGGERRSTGGIVIPATATMGKRLMWAEVVAVGQHVRTIEAGDQVLYDPEERAEVEIHGATYVMMRERDVHALASSRVEQGSTGLYL